MHAQLCVDPERGCLPSLEEMKGSLLKKVCIHARYVELDYCAICGSIMCAYVATHVQSGTFCG